MSTTDYDGSTPTANRGHPLARASYGATWRSVNALRAAAARGAALRRATVNLVFPHACASCHAELEGNGATDDDLPFCQRCLDSLDLLGPPWCMRCGAPVPIFGGIAAPNAESSSTIAGCFRCRGRRMWFDETIASGLYAGRLRDLLLQMKQSAGNSLSLAMGHLVWKHCRDRLTMAKPDVVVPIPLHWRRRLVHRTNSAALVAEGLADRLHVPLAEGLLRRRRHTLRQFDLTPPRRWENVRHAFAVRAAYHLKSAHVLVVDDILTTGATCSEAAKVLRKAGAERVTIAVVARAIGE